MEHWQWETRGDPHFNFWVALAGEGYLTCEGQTYPLRAGSFFVFSPNVEISAAHYSGKRITRFSAHFHPMLLGEVLGAVDGLPVLGGEVASLPLLQRQVDVVMRMAIRRENDVELAELLYRLIVQSCGQVDVGADASIDPRVAEAIRIFREAPASVASMDVLARGLGVSRSHFDREFSAQVGQAPKQFLLNCKMIHARRFLESSHLRVGEIAEALGYKDIYFFSRQFKAFCGMSPVNYRKSLQQ